ncbi:hypothetical protein EDC04DRAFT_352895 [Pisolithus marmoratus]|nr:hypothetical protein EDC04DRAFT_352895 [Pisolithus marmoratus]
MANMCSLLSSGEAVVDVVWGDNGVVIIGIGTNMKLAAIVIAGLKRRCVHRNWGGYELKICTVAEQCSNDAVGGERHHQRHIYRQSRDQKRSQPLKEPPYRKGGPRSHPLNQTSPNTKTARLGKHPAITSAERTPLSQRRPAITPAQPNTPNHKTGPATCNTTAVIVRHVQQFNRCIKTLMCK